MSRKNKVTLILHPPAEEMDLSSVFASIEDLMDFLGESAADSDYAKEIIVNNESVKEDMHHE